LGFNASTVRSTPKLSLTPTIKAVPETSLATPANGNGLSVVEEALPPYPPQPEMAPETSIAPVSVQQVRVHWKNYAERIRASKPFVHNAMTQFEIELTNGNDIVVKLSNPTLEESLIREAMPGIGAYLREQLRTSFHLVTKAADPVEMTTRKLYTSADKFNYLAEQNPLLLEMKNMFGLDMEF
jgi:DNA polymerase III subunit gamma/tau